MERQPGPDPADGRDVQGLNPLGEFLGVMDRAPEVNAQTTLIQLSAPSDGAAFGEKWSQQPVEIEATGPLLAPMRNCHLQKASAE